MAKRADWIAFCIIVIIVTGACSLPTPVGQEGKPSSRPAGAGPALESEPAPAKPLGKAAVDPGSIFPIFGWNGVPDPDEANIVGQVECGMTVATFAGPKVLPYCEKHGIPVILSDPRIRHDWTPANSKELEAGLRAAAREFGEHPGVFGFYLRDEPSAGDFAALARTAAIL